MRLVAFRMNRFRRFEETTTLDLTPRVVAIVGPNEAGKSSVLDGLEIATGAGRDYEWALSDFTGRKELDDNTEMVSALYALDESDYEALKEIPGYDSIRYWRRTRRANGTAYGEVLPNLSRPDEARIAARESVQRLLESPPRSLSPILDAHGHDLVDLEDEATDGDESPIAAIRDLAFRESLRRVLTVLQSEDDLTEDEIAWLEAMASLLVLMIPSRAPRWVTDIGPLLREVATEHTRKHPNARAFSILSARAPEVRVLRDADRQLRSSYAFDDWEDPPSPLANLLDLADLAWDELKSAAAEPSNPALMTMLSRANRRLRERLHGSWGQATVSVELTEQSGVLNVFPYDADSDTHTRIEDRSDGFRSFLALLAFTARHADGDKRLILGIDEAELHLHYDAQADLVRVLTQQTLAKQIIYTTHSAGCLPEDLGSAVRVIEPSPGDRSIVRNGFWSSRDHSGFTALLMAMGASTVAFTPTRRALIAEGPSDALLLPALFRQAAGLAPDDSLGFQVAGGLAWTPPIRISELESEASHVAYLADSDDDGLRYREQLLDAGVPSARIFLLGRPSSRLTIEDFVDKRLYVDALNVCLREHRGYDGDGIDLSCIPDSGGARAADEWMRSRGIDPVSKPRIAEVLLTLAGASLAYANWEYPGQSQPRQLARPGRRTMLARLLNGIQAAVR